MTTLAILSDIHGDVDSLRDALSWVRRLGCSMVVCAGDLVDYGPYPNETIDLLRQEQIPTISGNHDQAAATRPGDSPALSAASVAFLAGLRPSWDKTIEGVRVAVRHGTHESNANGIIHHRLANADVHRLLLQVRADVLLVGHTHRAFAVRGAPGGLIANPGALNRYRRADAQRFDTDRLELVLDPAQAGGTFGILEVPSLEFKVLRSIDGQEVAVR